MQLILLIKVLRPKPDCLGMQLEIGGKMIRMGGIAKGSGMIHPNMATMLAVVTCDAAVEPLLWRALFKRSAIKSFNQVRV